ncbi:MAG: pilus (MSHA type) biogenesis protein MshL, partial [Gammaproteobacteria bacterium]|nr:pilus (MSHA type) biogenesis protein MshL [Gammaproteobacteria bacterium]
AETKTSPSVTLTPFFSGIALDVTPQIDKDGNIMLHLHPTVSDVNQRSKSFTIDGKGFDLPLAASTVRETDTVVRAKSGQIIVVGGLMKLSSVDAEASVPLLGNLPLIGSLFKHKKASRVKKELVVLVKPTLVKNSTAWSNDATSTMMRFSELRE